MDTLAILVAAGRGERMGASRPKAFLELAGEPLLVRAARAFEAASCVDEVVAVVPAGERGRAEELLRPLGKVRAVVEGGERRQDSVREGLRAAAPGFEGVVLVHDAARPLVDVPLIERVARAAREHGAALPVLPLADTVKRVSEGRVRGTEPREELAAAQTPQGFRYRVLVDAYDRAYRDGLTVTDEAMAVERTGRPVVTVAGSPLNRKVTHAEDLAWAESLLQRSAGESPLRVGSGLDAHRLVRGRPLVLGTVAVPHDKGLEGHSDGDCLAHAICDALLGAAGLGDMGRYFPSHDERWRGAPGTAFLAETRRLVEAEGLAVANVDSTVVAEEPRLAPHADAMRGAIARALGLQASAVSVKVKSADGLGALGRGEGIAAQATVLLRRRSGA